MELAAIAALLARFAPFVARILPLLPRLIALFAARLLALLDLGPPLLGLCLTLPGLRSLAFRGLCLLVCRGLRPALPRLLLATRGGRLPR
jgi:hypothetical protein